MLEYDTGGLSINYNHPSIQLKALEALIRRLGPHLTLESAANTLRYQEAVATDDPRQLPLPI